MKMHKCSKCGTEFDPANARVRPQEWWRIFTREPSWSPTGEDLKTFDLVRCPNCNQEDHASELKAFGLFGQKRLNLLLILFLCIILVFGYWEVFVVKN